MKRAQVARLSRRDRRVGPGEFRFFFARAARPARPDAVLRDKGFDAPLRAKTSHSLEEKRKRRGRRATAPPSSADPAQRSSRARSAAYAVRTLEAWTPNATAKTGPGADDDDTLQRIESRERARASPPPAECESSGTGALSSPTSRAACAPRRCASRQGIRRSSESKNVKLSGGETRKTRATRDRVVALRALRAAPLLALLVLGAVLHRRQLSHLQLQIQHLLLRRAAASLCGVESPGFVLLSYYILNGYSESARIFDTRFSQMFRETFWRLL